MKSKCIVFSLILSAAMMLAPAYVQAANDDFEVEYAFSPDQVGYRGADAALTLTVTNEGSTNITWLDVVINTQSTYSEHWTGTIAPGHSRTLSYIVPFNPADLNKDKILQVAINNDSDTNPDGVQMFHFEIEAVEDILSAAEERLPDRGLYLPGETVTFTHRITNNMTTHAAIGVILGMALMGEDGLIIDFGTTDYGNIFPGETKSADFGYAFETDYEGAAHVSYSLGYTMMGRSYVEAGQFTDFEAGYLEAVPLSPPDVRFAAGLRADTSEIDAGDTVTFSVDIENTGDDAIGGFDIRNAEGGLEASAESLPSGESGTVSMSVPVYETCTVSYTVVGRTGDTSVTHETNSITITIAEPETPTPAPAPTPAASDAAGLASPSASVSPTPTMTPTVAPRSPTPSPMPEETKTAAGMDRNPALLYVLIALGALLMLVAIVLVILLLRKKKKGTKADPPAGDREG